jgi:hypothetical protein
MRADWALRAAADSLVPSGRPRRFGSLEARHLGGRPRRLAPPCASRSSVRIACSTSSRSARSSASIFKMSIRPHNVAWVWVRRGISRVCRAWNGCVRCTLRLEADGGWYEPKGILADCRSVIPFHCPRPLAKDRLRPVVSRARSFRPGVGQRDRRGHHGLSCLPGLAVGAEVSIKGVTPFGGTRSGRG